MSEIKQQYVMVGKSQAQIAKITCVAGTSLGGKYFVFFAQDGTKHYAWYNTGASTDPAPAGWTGHEVDVLTTDSASQVASKTQAILDAVTGFDCTVNGAILTLTCSTAGYCQAPHGQTGTEATGFSFEITQIGMVEENIGCIQGDIEVSPFNYSTLEVKCHATGPTVVQELITGIENPTLSFTLQDTSKAKIEKLFAWLGGASTTSVAADATKVFGFGTALIGKAKPFIPVRLHPVVKDANDKSEDWNIWKTNLSLESFTFAAEDVATCSVSFKAYPDDTKHKEHNVIMLGDAASAITVI